MNISLNPLKQIRLTCQQVVDTASSVVINNDAIDSYVDTISPEDVEALRAGVEWDKCGWHYCKDSKENGPLTCQYIFVMDSLNFCFWPTPALEYDILASRLRDVLEADSTAFDASNLANITPVRLSIL